MKDLDTPTVLRRALLADTLAEIPSHVLSIAEEIALAQMRAAKVAERLESEMSIATATRCELTTILEELEHKKAELRHACAKAVVERQR